MTTLHDYFAETRDVKTKGEKAEDTKTVDPGTENPDNGDDQDSGDPAVVDWSLQYIHVKYLLPIVDAIDDDASGYITVAEVNRFTEQLPKELGWKYVRIKAFHASSILTASID